MIYVLKVFRPGKEPLNIECEIDWWICRTAREWINAGFDVETSVYYE